MAFGLGDGVGNFFDVAFKFIQTGAKVLEEEEEKGFVQKREKLRLDSNIPMPRAQLREMDAPIGMKPATIQAAARFFANNQARDTNINSIKAERFNPSRSRKIAPTGTTMNVSYNASPSVGSARTARVNRSTFRSRV